MLWRNRTVSLGLMASLILLVLGSACGGIVEIVPLPTPAPSPLPRLSPISPLPTPVSPALPERITAEAITLDAPVVAMGWQQVERWGQLVSEWEIPESGAAWHQNSARPGEGSNIVISGHNNSAGSRVFAHLEELEIGDRVTLWDQEERVFVYEVSEKNLVRTLAATAEAEAYLEAVMEPTAREQLTLITCWPSWSNTHRLIIIAQPL